MIKIATLQYNIEKLRGWQSYENKINALAIKAKNAGAQFLLLPEYAGIEVVCNAFNSDVAMFEVIQTQLQAYLDLYQRLAQEQQLYIQAGSSIVAIGEKRYVNRAYFFSPNGKVEYQDKIQLTPFEKKSKLFVPGDQLKIFNTTFGPIGIAICYDVEFPELVRKLCFAGAKLILVPSYTTTLAGFYRVFNACCARAIENQCYFAVSYVVGNVDVDEPPEATYGRAAIITPADVGFPDDGVLVIGDLNQTQMVSETLNFEKLDTVRQSGQVTNFQDSQSLTVTKEVQPIDL